MASAARQKTENTITLRGSTEIVTEFFGYSINSILYQRGIYPPETFTRVSKYGLAMLVTADEKLKAYLSQIFSQLSGWLLEGKVQKLVMVIAGVDSKETKERWVFNIETDGTSSAGDNNNNQSQLRPASVAEKPVSEVMNEIQAIIRQITASVSFLPLLNEPCAFDLLVYTDKDAEVPLEWEESDPQFINNATKVRLRSFSTKIHKVDAMVAYKDPDECDV